MVVRQNSEDTRNMTMVCVWVFHMTTVPAQAFCSEIIFYGLPTILTRN